MAGGAVVLGLCLVLCSPVVCCEPVTGPWDERGSGGKDWELHAAAGPWMQAHGVHGASSAVITVMEWLGLEGTGLHHAMGSLQGSCRPWQKRVQDSPCAHIPSSASRARSGGWRCPQM